MTKSLKRWSVNAVSEGQAPLTLFCDDRPLGRSAIAALETLSPVQYLLISIASCFALSCRAELSRRKLANTSFEVVVIGEKEIGAAENLLNAISIVAIFGSGIAEPLAQQIMERAKPLCTVTNTLLDSPNLQFRSRALRQRRTVPRELPAQHSAH
jgi:uncharacterized OsmC-like protein